MLTPSPATGPRTSPQRSAGGADRTLNAHEQPGRTPSRRHRRAASRFDPQRSSAGPAGVSGRGLLALALCAAALVGAFVLAPGRLAAGRSDGDLVNHHQLIADVHSGFVEYWHSDSRQLSPHLARVVDYWYRFHLVKGLISVLLLAVLLMLTIALWKNFLTAGGAARRAGLASAGVFTPLLALLALAAVMANIQGAAAPLSSLLPMLSEGGTDPALADALGQATRQLADSPSGAQTVPALHVMTADFARYHVVMAVIAAVLAVVLFTVSVLLWKRVSVDRRATRVTRVFGVLTAVLTLALLVHVAANVSAAAHSASVLLDGLRGGL
ncbi:hypothetical protein [Frankia sp. R82]|uniref:hypothetical protein n=1 Tax=Frankia sp. R82 TaxID=2950553 RepID=UPI002044C1FA|nr:hypothetical protein [Frankia sp. R82]MCM3882756.1 hypothetical protein [Frankia sp. R82]